MPSHRRAVASGLLAALLLLAPSGARAEAALAAVAANFAAAAEALAADFAAATGHAVTITTGSTGKLYAQIVAGAPFDLLLSADAATPARLVDEGLAVEGTAFTYARGRLALWSADPARIGPDGRAALADEGLRFVAIANPALAPYGVAAREALQAMGLWDALQPKIVMGQNVGQAHALVATGAAELGLVARSAVVGPDGAAGGSRWDVPQALFAPILQDAVLLGRGEGRAAAEGFLAHLRTPAAAEIIARHGYGSP